MAGEVVFYVLGAPFLAAREVITYAGAIMVLFVFVVMMLNLGQRAIQMESGWLRPGIWTGPAVLAAVLIAEVVYLLSSAGGVSLGIEAVGPKQVSLALFGPYLLGVELASVLLMA